MKLPLRMVLWSPNSIFSLRFHGPSYIEMSLLDAAAVSSVLSVEYIDEDIDSQEFIQAVNVASSKFKPGL